MKRVILRHRTGRLAGLLEFGGLFPKELVVPADVNVIDENYDHKALMTLVRNTKTYLLYEEVYNVESLPPSPGIAGLHS